MAAPAVAPRRTTTPAAIARLSSGPGALVALLALAAGLRFGTIHLQSFWYDEAYTPVHVLRPSLSATLSAMVHHENTPPLWYLLAWLDVRIFGSGVIALRSLSAIAGVATVAVAWSIGRELAGERCAIVLAALTAANPLMLWYSQEARAYGLFILFAAFALLWFLRVARDPSPRHLVGWATFGALSLLSHYFAVFLLVPQAAWLLWPVLEGRAPAGLARRLVPPLAAIAIVGVALIPLIVAQGGHGTQWIGRWALSSRLQAIPQYLLLGESGEPLGHGIELLVALPALGALVLVAARGLEPAEARVALLTAGIGVVAMLAPLVLVALGSDYLAPRNLVADYMPLAAALAVLLASRRAGAIGPALAATLVVAFLAVDVAVDARARLQRGDWSGVAAALRGAPPGRAIVVPELGAAPLEYYMPPLRNLPRHTGAAVSEIDLVGYSPLVADPGRPPAPGFSLVERRNERGLVLYRFRAASPHIVAAATLRRAAITLQQPEVLVPGRGAAGVGPP